MSFWDADAGGDETRIDEALRHALPERRPVELHDAGGEHRPACWKSIPTLDPAQVRTIVSLKLALVGLAGFEDYYPARDQRRHEKAGRSGPRHGARPGDTVLRRALGRARSRSAPSLLDELILELRDSLGATVVMVTHELASIFAIGNNSVFLDAESRTMLATGDPKKLLTECENPTVRSFLTRGKATAPRFPGRARAHAFRPEYSVRRHAREGDTMSKAANKTMIGAFVLGAVVLAVIAVLIFGSGKFFTAKQFFELYFQGSVQGLDLGSPVMFRGVKVGSVTDISLIFIPKELTFYIPVTIAIEPGRAKWLGTPRRREGQLVKPLIEKGLRGQLQTQSFVTGQLAVALDFFPNQPARFVGLDKKYPEIPTVPSTFAQLTKTIQELPIKNLFEKLDATVGSINRLVSSEAAQNSMESLQKGIKEATVLMKTINARVGPLVASLQSTSDGINGVAKKADAALSGDQGVPAQLQVTLETARKTLAQATEMLSSVQATAQENSTMGYELGTAVSEMSRTVRSLRVLSDYLERHPEALLWGKKAP